MNRRGFFATIAKAALGGIVVPAASAIWKPKTIDEQYRTGKMSNIRFLTEPGPSFITPHQEAMDVLFELQRFHNNILSSIIEVNERYDADFRKVIA